MIKLQFHSFSLGDCEDPELYAAQPIWEWQQTEHGRWVTDHAHNLTFHVHVDANTMGYRVFITGSLEEDSRATEYLLKWPTKKY